VEIHELPDISAGADTVICLQDAAQLMGSGGISYIWSPADALSCTHCPNPLASPKVKTEYTVIGTDVHQCSDTDRVVVSLKTKVESIAGKGGEICEDETITLTASGAHHYEWSPAYLLDNSKLREPVASPRSNTKFMVVAFEGSCIPDTNFVEVIVHPKPTVKASGGTTIIAGSETPLNAEGSAIQSFLWTPSGTLDCYDCPAPLAKPIRTTTYTVIATTAFGCSDSDKVTIRVLCDNSQLFIPNTFTPNNDGQNDVFYPRGVGFDKLRAFRIFNRWGEIVFEKRDFPLNDKGSGWDGTFRGRELPPDVFMYTVEVDCEGGETMLWKGDVTIIR
jgi:gliding motility-associated-like protein